MTSANAVKTAATATTQRLRMRSRNSLAAMRPTCPGSIASRMSVRRVAEKDVFERGLAKLEVEHAFPERGNCLEHRHLQFAAAPDRRPVAAKLDVPDRSEERRVGKECRSRWSPYH